MEESYEWYCANVFFFLFFFDNQKKIIPILFEFRLVEQYEKELNYYASTNQNKTELILCPICQISELKLVNNVLGCDCGIR